MEEGRPIRSWQDSRLSQSRLTSPEGWCRVSHARLPDSPCIKHRYRGAGVQFRCLESNSLTSPHLLPRLHSTSTLLDKLALSCWKFTDRRQEDLLLQNMFLCRYATCQRPGFTPTGVFNTRAWPLTSSFPICYRFPCSAAQWLEAKHLVRDLLNDRSDLGCPISIITV